jgi:Arc/MetJ-type ribon-helix-helix transcriptional regulator
MKIKLDEHCALVIQNALSNDKYENANAMIHKAITLLTKKEAEETLVAELQKGIDSGFDHNFDYPGWLQSVKTRFK